MARTRISTQMLAGPDTIKALNKSFTKVEKVDFPDMKGAGDPMFVVFELQGQGVPNDQRYIDLELALIEGEVRVRSWQISQMQ